MRRSIKVTQVNGYKEFIPSDYIVRVTGVNPNSATYKDANSKVFYLEGDKIKATECRETPEVIMKMIDGNKESFFGKFIAMLIIVVGITISYVGLQYVGLDWWQIMSVIALSYIIYVNIIDKTS